ncbi:DNA-deoxyinosine glycosylase [Achromobacter xylosoxidans]
MKKTDSAPAAGRPASQAARHARDGAAPADAPVLQGFAPVTTPQARCWCWAPCPAPSRCARAATTRIRATPSGRSRLRILGFDPALDYALRLERLTQAGVALWDVLQGCEREGSLDADIRNAVPNDFAGFLRAHPQLRRVCLNGGKAASLFRRQCCRRYRRAGGPARLPGPAVDQPGACRHQL